MRRSERQRRGTGVSVGTRLYRWRRHTHLAEGHRAGKRCVRDGVSRLRLGHTGRGDPQNGAKEAVVCGGMLPAGARAGRRRRAEVGGSGCVGSLRRRKAASE